MRLDKECEVKQFAKIYKEGWKTKVGNNGYHSKIYM